MTATGNLMTMLTRTQECVVHDLTGAGKAGVTRGSVSEASCIGADGPTVPKGLVPAAPDSQTPSKPLRIDGNE